MAGKVEVGSSHCRAVRWPSIRWCLPMQEKWPNPYPLRPRQCESSPEVKPTTTIHRFMQVI